MNFFEDLIPKKTGADPAQGSNLFADLLPAAVNRGGKSDQAEYSPQVIADDIKTQSLQELKNAGTGLLGLPGLVADLGSKAAVGLYGMAGGTPEQGQELLARLKQHAPPTMGEINQQLEPLTGADVKPLTWQGDLAGSVTGMAAGLIGPGGPVRKVAQVVAPGVASFAAGQATKGTALEPWARMAGGLAGGIGAGLGAKQQAVNSILKDSPFKSQKQLNRAVEAAYDELRSAGATYAPDDFGRMAGSLGNKLARAGLMEADAPKTWKRVNMILEGAQTGRAPSWDEINSMRTGLGTLMRSAEGPERAAAAKVFDELAEFEKTAGMTSAAGFSQEEMVRKAASARELALRNIKAKEFGKREANAETYTTGIESGLRNQTANMLRTKYGTRLFKNEAERETLKDVTAGGPMRKILATAGKAGFDWSKMGNVNALGPAIAAGLPLAASGGYGYSTGDWKTAAAILAAGSAAKIGARKLTERDARKAMALILAGPEAQHGIARAVKGNRRDAIVRLLLAGEGASLPTRE